MSRRLYLARASAADAPQLARLAALCHSHPWTAEQIAAEVALGPPAGVLVLRGLSSGHLEICASCAYRVAADEAEVLDVSVHPAWRRQGLALSLLRFVLARAERAGATTAHLEVRAGNGAGLALYERLGFGRTGRRRGYYSEPTEDAVLLARALGGPGRGPRAPGRPQRPQEPC